MVDGGLTMETELDSLLGRYEIGQISRPELLAALAALLLPGTGRGQEPQIGAANALNHVTLFVSDVEQSRKFYQDLFGLPVLTHQPPGVNLRAGAGFLGLYPAEPGTKPRIDHFCLGLDRFDPDTTRRKLASVAVEATIRLRGDTPELYFTDPDGIRVQLQDVRYRGGVGPLGDRDPR